MKLLPLRNLCVLCISAVIFAVPFYNRRDAETAEVAQSYLEFDTPDFKLKLVKDSQTVAALEPRSAAGFDFTPADRLEKRTANGYHHLGDLTLRTRIGTSGPWQKYDTAESRKPVEPLTPTGTTSRGPPFCRQTFPYRSRVPGSSTTAASSCASISGTNPHSPSRLALSAFRWSLTTSSPVEVLNRHTRSVRSQILISGSMPGICKSHG